MQILEGVTGVVQINLCTLAMRQHEILDIFNLPASSSSQVRISVKKAAANTNVVGRRTVPASLSASPSQRNAYHQMQSLGASTQGQTHC